MQAISPNPSFNYAARYAKSIGIDVKLVPLRADLSFDFVAMKEAADSFDRLSIYYLCNPNNPTALLTPSSVMNEFIKTQSDKFFLIDEAYAKLITKPNFISAIKLVKQGSENIAVTRTFSKLYALAGEHVGYAISSEANTDEFKKFLSFDNMNLSGLVAASAAIDDEIFKQYSLKSINLSKQIATKAIDELGLKYVSAPYLCG